MLVGRQRGLVRACLLGTFWGAGHTVSLLAASLAVIVFRLSIPTGLERALDTAVGALLVLLGARALGGALRGVRFHRHGHAHGECRQQHFHFHADVTREHAGPHEHAHRGLLRLAGQPFLIGVLHGLAGSAALMLLVLASIPSAGGGLVYVATFALGSSVGMLLLSAAMGLPLALGGGRWRAARVGIQLLAGGASRGLGAWPLWTLAAPSHS